MNDAYENAVTHVVEVKTRPNGFECLAYVVGYYDSPTYILEKSDGTRFSWRCDLCESAAPNEEVDYWKKRAEIAEAKIFRYQQEVGDE